MKSIPNYRNVVFGTTMALTMGVSWLSGCESSESPMVESFPPSTPADPRGQEGAAWERRHYIDKVARALRLGAGLSPSEDADALAHFTPEQIVDHFMEDPRLVDTVFDFNMYFLGLKRNDIRLPDGNWNPDRLTPRRAIHAALEFERGGNFLSLLALEQPEYVFRPVPRPIEGQTFSKSDALRHHLRRVLDDIDSALASVEAGEDLPTFCKKALAGDIFAFSYNFESVEMSAFPFDSQYAKTRRLILPCDSPGSFPLDHAADELRELHDYVIKLHDYEQELLLKGPPSGSLHDFIEVDLQRIGAPEMAKAFDVSAFWNLVPNSSTNQNRKRAAYMLDRYFCDDLKPINAALPASHAGDRHASEPACKSCHYKLDPMAGFFRRYGLLGADVGNYANIVFDDAAVQSRASYDANWASSDPATRAWDVGYVRSSTNPSLNSYGESMEDLFRIIESAPEVKSCLVRRTFQYFNGEQQLVDPGYLAQLSTAFIEDSKENSSTAFRRLVRRVLTGATFQKVRPHSGECYDFAPGVDAASRPPCAVAFVLQKNCATCHSGPGAQGGLDLTSWLPDTGSFPHRGPDGLQRTARDTLERMLERISTSDPARQMPAGRSMAGKDREDLYLWLTGRLGALP